jgi:hypothetical protein
MGAKSGDLHHNKVKLLQEQDKFLTLIRQGVDTDSAFATLGRRKETLKKWLTDGSFAAKLDDARIVGEDVLQASIADGKHNIDFKTFSKEFLHSEVFPHHQSWIDVLEGRKPSWLHEAMTYDPGDPQRLLVNVPPEHAKSTVLTVNYATYRIAMDPNIRIAIVSQTQTRAKEFLYAIKQRLTDQQFVKLHQVYGPAGGWQQTADQWTQDRIYLERSSGDPNPTVQALGVGQQIYGARADLIILDDIVTTTNAHEWEKQLNWLQKMVITRLGKNGKLIIAGTRVSSVDLYKELRNPDNWAGGKSPFTYLAMPAVLEFADKPKNWVTLWAKSDRPWIGDEDEEPDKDGYFPKWDGVALNRRRSEVMASTWALVYQQQDVEEDAVFPPALVNSAVNRMRKPGNIRIGAPGHPTDGQWVLIMGLDPAMAGKTAAIMYAVDRTSGRRMVLDVFNMHEPTPGKIRALIEDWITRYQPMELRVEINAFQKAFALDEDLRQWLANRGVQFREHFTGKNKWDINFGVAGMSALFGSLRDGKPQKNNLLELPDATNEHIKALINQLITWKPDTKNATDCVMALWFCEIRAKELILQGNNRQHHQYNRFATRKNVAAQGVINLDELAAEQSLIYI